jgi:hypothetical protein
VTSTKTLDAGNWPHIAGTYDGSTLKIYFNGTLYNAKSAVGKKNLCNTLNIGRKPANYWTPTEYFNGVIDEIRIYNRALSADEIQSLADPGSISTPVAYYPFNGNANDESGNGNNGTMIGSPTLTADRFGNTNSAYFFDGVDDHLEIKSPSINDLTPENLSISLWFKSGINRGAIIDKYSPGEGYALSMFGTGGNKSIYWQVSGYGRVILFIATNTWTHVVVASDKLYVNGVYAGKIGFLDGYVYKEPDTNLRFGTYLFNGSIDDIRIYDYVLPLHEIQALYNDTSGSDDNTAPVASAGADQTITTGSLVTLDGSGSSDADGDALTYSWSFISNPGNAVLSGSTAVNPMFTPNVDGTYVLRLVVNDGTEDSTADTVTVTVSPAAATGFHPYVKFPTGSRPSAVAIGDINNDGKNDVVMSTSYYFDAANDYHIFLFIQNSSGQLELSGKYRTSGSYNRAPDTIDIGDVNNDGLNDVVVGNSKLNIEVFLQKATGGFGPSVKYATVDSTKIKIADFNNDGLNDVAGIGWGTNTATLFFQDDSGAFGSPVTYSVTHGGYDDLDAGDVNNDGLIDIVVMSGQTYAIPNVGVRIQRNDGTFESAAYYDLVNNVNSKGVAVGDVNGDSLSDVVISYGGNRPSSKIGIFYQNGSGTLDAAVSNSSYDCPEPVEIADIDSDGRNDIVVVHGGWNTVGVYHQRSDGSLMTEKLYALPYATHYNPHGLDVGDINNDGRNDIVTANYNYGLVVLYHK